MTLLEIASTVAMVTLLIGAIAVLGSYLIAWLREVETPEWTDEALGEVIADPDPLDPATVIQPYELVDPRVFDELVLVHAIRLDWAPPTFSQEWEIAGQVARDLGDTTEMQRVEVPA